MQAIKAENPGKWALLSHNNAKAASATYLPCHSEAAIAAEESQATGTGRAVLIRCR
jgi:hypothetical protein